MSTAAAAVLARARRQVQHHFFAADAVRADRAVAFEPANRAERRHFERLAHARVIHEVAGRYWLDIPAYDAWLHARLYRVRLLLGLLVLLVATYAALTSAVVPR